MSTVREKPPSALPLTRAAMAAWPRWRDATFLKERRLVERVLHADEAAALQRLEGNLAAAGPTTSWYYIQHGEVQVRRGLVERLLGGLVVTEGAKRDVCRTLCVWGPGVPCGGPARLEEALRAWIGRGVELVQTKGARDMATVERGSVRERVEAELDARGIDPVGQGVALTVQREIAEAVQCSASWVSAILVKIRAQRGLAAEQAAREAETAGGPVRAANGAAEPAPAMTAPEERPPTPSLDRPVDDLIREEIDRRGLDIYRGIARFKVAEIARAAVCNMDRVRLVIFAMRAEARAELQTQPVRAPEEDAGGSLEVAENVPPGPQTLVVASPRAAPDVHALSDHSQTLALQMAAGRAVDRPHGMALETWARVLSAAAAAVALMLGRRDR